ncbi:ectoine/hydroxyectoine ABC transporter ATP-binding protein EhuA [Bradyrhizobium xenonodulans]|uniref:Ectoine/hydroxyectoine ABC transporter ATP-binding protein EhuA n=1 Tax=Bradyrhizobium xenonodulans TaxID=2736875 RepID=A0ABY7MYQ9_9BRAD|nr:ectoine/hydroxyectoine ABC transporter ATP-binding protein EhuA [Bradyrhizobium xenonodulans]WBL82751.1 ectoine/hydroxyectoine ABC transporter ATP-binding protein EhuA [Bradyrhizobium xenonodulans]
MADPPSVRFTSISKSFGEIKVLQDVSFDVAAGEKLALIGPSGSGKTTILRLLMTLETPTSGTIEVNGELLGLRRVGGKLVPDRPAHIREVRRQIGMVFQQFNLFPHMTVMANIIEAPVQVLGMERTEAEAQAMQLLQAVGLAEKASSFPRQLSGGQQQRVAIARALALRPRIMLFDEITSALDPELIGEVLNVVRQLARDTGMTMLIVTHEMNFARDVADRVMFMADGRIVETGSPEQIFTDPQNERTRQFLRAVLSH